MSQLSPPGSSSYSSNTMSVGDGTWDTSRNTFLLPNLVGFNLATTQYNGMGNRFRELPQYHSLIRAHGIIAAITFLGIVPTAILIVRFYGRSPRWALRFHIWLQIMTVLLTTVVFVLGWFAVGPSRSLTNPHHSIGLTIYVLVLFQAIGGWWVHKREKMKRRMYEPFKVMFHHWIGRLIALLGLAQIPLGLALYGSPVALFVLYALAAFALLVIYFILEYLRGRRGGSDYDSRYSYGTGSVVDERTPTRRKSRTGNAVKGAIAGAGLYALADRFRSRRSSGRNDTPEVVGSQRHSGSYVEDEKYSDYGRHDDRGGRWEDRIYKIAVPLGAAGAVTWLMNRRHRDRESDDGGYSPPLGGPVPVNDGRYDGTGGRPPVGGPVPPNQPLPMNQHPLNQPPPPGSQQGLPPPGLQPGLPPGQRPPNRPPSSTSYSSYNSASNQRRTGGHGLRDGLATLGAFGLARSIWNRRKERKEDHRPDEEQDARAHGHHLTGDGRPQRHRPPGGGESTLTTDSSSIGGQPSNTHGVPPVPAGAYPGGASVVGAAPPGRGRNTVEELPLGGIPRNGQLPMPEIPPDRHGGLFHPDSSGSEVFIGADGRNHWRHSASRDAAAAAGGLAAHETSNRRRDRQESPSPLAAAEAGPSRRKERRASASGEESAGTPVSVKVKMHNGGRHVTLRRLPEAEAAAEREARRRSRDRAGRKRGDSASSLGGSEGSTQRFRRNQAQERQQAEAMRIESERLAAARAQAQAQSNPNMPPNVPAPPPIPETSSGMRPGPAMSVGSPGTYDGNNTDASEYANNRRRRRAERAQAKQAKEAKKVEFE